MPRMPSNDSSWVFMQLRSWRPTDPVSQPYIIQMANTTSFIIKRSVLFRIWSDFPAIPVLVAFNYIWYVLGESLNGCFVLFAKSRFAEMKTWSDASSNYGKNKKDSNFQNAAVNLFFWITKNPSRWKQYDKLPI